MPEFYQHFIYAQIVLEIILVFFLFKLIRANRNNKDAETKANKVSSSNLAKTEKALSVFIFKAEKLSSDFTKNLEEKKRLSSDLILKLDRRIKEYEKLLSILDERTDVLEVKLKQKPALIHSGDPGSTRYSDGKANPAAPETRALVLRLAEKGLSLEEIALEAKLHKGEVELIIDLERQFSF